MSEWFSVHRIIYFWCQGGPGQLYPQAVNALSIIDSSAPIPGDLAGAAGLCLGFLVGVRGGQGPGGFVWFPSSQQKLPQAQAVACQFGHWVGAS